MDDIDILISNNNYDIVKSVELIKEFYHTKYLFIFGIEKLKIMNKMKEWIQKILSIILKDSSNIISYEDCINSSEIIKSMDFKKEYALFLHTILRKFGGNSFDWEYAGNELEKQNLFEEAGECFYFAIQLAKKDNVTPIIRLERLIDLWVRRARNYGYRKRFIDEEAADMMVQHLKLEYDQLKKNQDKVILETQFQEVPKKVDQAYKQLLKKRENRMINYNNV